MSPFAHHLLPFLAWRSRVTATSLRADLVAGVVGAFVVLPQGVAYAALAGLPVEYGLYAAMLPVAVAALWGSSWHQMSGPTNTVSLAVFAVLSPLAVPGSPDYVRLALTLALLVGIVQLVLGFARLGRFVNFISHTVVVGFTAGAGVLIVASQLRHFFGVDATAGADFVANVLHFAAKAREIDPATTATGMVTIVTVLLARRFGHGFPPMIAGLLAGGLFAFGLAKAGVPPVAMVGALPTSLPPLSRPSFDPETWRALAPATVALVTLTLAQSVSVARSVAVRSGQRIDGSQEFIGQGLSNVVAAFSSGYVSSGSFNRIWVNYHAGAQTPLAAVFSAAFLAAIVLVVAPLAAWLPMAVMAGLLFVVAVGLVDVREMRRIARTSRGDGLTLAGTFIATLVLQVEFAIFVGVLASLLVYLNRTTHPRVTRITPDRETGRFLPASAVSPPCPQLDILRIDGSLFFGAVEHVRDELEQARRERPEVRHVLLVGSGVNFIDLAGAELLAQTARDLRALGGALYLCNLKDAVREALARGDAQAAIGAERIFEAKAQALAAIYASLDAKTCATCGVRAFSECQEALPDGTPRERVRPAFSLTPVR